MDQRPTARRSLRVLRVAHHGVVTAWRERERELIRRGVDLTLVSATRWNEGGRDVELDFGADGFVRGVGTLGTHPNGFLYDPRALWRFLGQCWDLIDLHEEPCALATAEILAMMRLRRNRTPVVLYSAQNIHKRYPPPIRWFERTALRVAEGAYVCNVEAGRILQDKGLRHRPWLIGLGTDLSIFRPGPHDAPRSPLRVGYSGRLETYKGVDVLLRAMAHLPDAELSIAGEGPQRSHLVELAATLGIEQRVTFLGHLGADLPAFYRDLDVLAVPSLPTKSWLEQFGRVVVEGMASGVPVVASRSGALPDVVGEAGVLVEPGDPKKLADGIGLLRDRDRWAALRAAGLEHCRQYSWKAVAVQQRAFYDSVLEPAAARSDPEVVIVAYGPPDALRDALTPLAGWSITVVDNSSLPATRSLVEGAGGHYIDAGANLGFGAAVNRALASLRERGLDGADVLLLNPDATIEASAIHALAEALHEQPGIACVAPRQTEPGRSRADLVQWPFPTPLGAWLIALGLGRLDRRPGFVIGSILLLNRDAIDDVGSFDERFFLYAEETDWQKRAVEAGWRIRYFPQVTGTHVGAGTSTDETVRSTLFHSSQLAYMRKHYGVLGSVATRAAVVVGSLLRVVAGRGETRKAALWRLRFYLRPGVPGRIPRGGNV